MSDKSKSKTAAQRALALIAKMGGMINTSQAQQAGIHPRTLYQLRNTGELKQISRGIYCLAQHEPTAEPDLSIVALRAPSAVICLVSALAYHGITTQIPSKISIAIPKGCESPRIDYPPISIHRFSEQSYQAGIEEHKINSAIIRIYNIEKTLADCFKFRNKIGMDIVIEALKNYIDTKEIKLDKLIHYAKICRVEKVMKPYLETML